MNDSYSRTFSIRFLPTPSASAPASTRSHLPLLKLLFLPQVLIEITFPDTPTYLSTPPSFVIPASMLPCGYGSFEAWLHSDVHFCNSLGCRIGSACLQTAGLLHPEWNGT